MMKLFIKNILAFAVFSVVFYSVAILVWKSFLPIRFSPNINYNIGAYGHIHTRLKELKNTEDIDILFLGSSHSYRGFDTRIFSKKGFNSFNLGSGAQTPIQTIALLNRYLDKFQPKLIVYEVYPPTLISDGVESSLEIISNDKNDIHSYKMAFQINQIKTYNTLIYASFRELFNLNESFSEPLVKEHDTYIKGGYVEKKMAYYTPKPFLKEKIVLNQDQLIQFEKIVNKITNKGIKLVLVYAPIPSNRYSRYTNNDYFDSLMTTYSEYYNFNNMMNLNDSLHFYDSHHLNQDGVTIFNERLLEILDK